ncbi:Prosaposin [Pseudolycoriella hygida]|uniref:Prosaposin n=1 Tax=Pseudolycoriella hygida TaxID=35572 RepID=A0A9Q0MTP7_9DIPT|nr:Prosaposin [Pseudolycoriella hygida]
MNMKLLLLALCGCFFGAAVIIASPINEQQRSQTLLGAKECTYGPSYWCSNITNAKSCNAVQHCIQTVWETHSYPEDSDSICKICLDMVGQARDQLESNETQEELKEVFEGSCNLIPLKLVRKECDKLADDFVPELVEALASQMNPQAVCSVAGLCNNAAIDKMLEEMTEGDLQNAPKSKQLSCEQCNSVGSLISQKFHGKNRDEVLDSLLGVCGQLSSLSDACANIVLVYFNEIYDELNKNLNSDSICHMAGVCAANYHKHPEIVEIRPRSDVGFVTVTDDIPCELCEQLVGHLRDLLIANTTEAEFKQVLQGLCKQTKGFKTECLSIVDEYYDVIYNTLVKDLNPNEACCLMEICPRGLGKSSPSSAFMPLLPVETAQRVGVTIQSKPKKFVLGANEPHYSADEIQNFQLPIDTLLTAPNPELLVDGGNWCTMCEYFLHFVQETMASPKNEFNKKFQQDNIKKAVDEACDNLPKGIAPTCRSFVENYGDALIALLIQEIDPKDVCPKLYLCPSSSKDFEVFAPGPVILPTIDVTINAKNSGSEKCPLCLFAVQEALTLLKDDKSTENIKRTLEGLCSHLNNKLKPECKDFVDTYTSELIKMLADDFTADDICVYLKVCTNSTMESVPAVVTGGDVLTNEIPDYTYNGYVVKNNEVDYAATPNCMLCEEVVKEIEKNIKNKKSKEDIERALQHACDRLHKLRNKCKSIVTKHGDKIADLIIKGLAPKVICSELGMCFADDNLQIDEAVQVSVIAIPSKVEQTKAVGVSSDSPLCVICEYVMTQLEVELKDKKTQEEIENTVRNICKKMPKTVNQKCTKFVNDYGTLIITLIATTPPKELCTQMQLCSDKERVEGKNEVIECAICHASTQALVKILDDPNTVHSVEHAVEEICPKLPGKYYDRCIALIESYGQSMINIINKGELQTVCSQIGMCYPNEYQSFVQIDFVGAPSKFRSNLGEKPHLLGASKCTYGPSYWCSHVDNAKDCNATKYCESNGWLVNTS